MTKYICKNCGKYFFDRKKNDRIRKYCSRLCCNTFYTKDRIIIIKSDCALVPLTQNKFAIIDLDDVEKVKDYNWYYENGYASNKSDGKTIKMHRLIMPTSKGFDIDHIDGNGLNNRKYNLRICTHQQNCFNSKKQHKTTSKFKGVSWRSDRNKWRAYLFVNGKQFSGGFFSKEILAAKKHDEMAMAYFGEYAKLNLAEAKH